jgi:hypothetical protein
MAYSDFKTLKSLEKEIGVKYDVQQLFPKPISLVAPSEKLLFDLEEALAYGLLSEKAKSEFIITPFLKEVRRQYAGKLTFLSGIALDTSIEKMNGICDYVFSQADRMLELTAPILCVVEAKNRTLEEGFAQCGAELYAAHIFNQENDEPKPCIYGAVTNAYEWVFMKFQNNHLTIDQDRFALQKTEELLGVFRIIFDFFITR